MKETEIAKPVVDLLEGKGFEVFQEVVLCGAIPDIVCISPEKFLHVIEVKTSLNLEVMAQALSWVNHKGFDYISIAVPDTLRGVSGGRVLGQDLLKAMRINIYKVDFDSWNNTYHVIEPHDFMLHESDNEKRQSVLNALCQEQKNAAKAGTQGGERWTVFRQRMKQIYLYVRDHPGCTIKECEQGARESGVVLHSMRGYLTSGMIAGIWSDRTTRPMQLIPWEADEIIAVRNPWSDSVEVYRKPEFSRVNNDRKNAGVRLENAASIIERVHLVQVERPDSKRRWRPHDLSAGEILERMKSNE